MKNQILIEEITKKIKIIFPQVANKYEIISLKNNCSEVKLLSNNNNLRPGNTISGPSMFELADISFYIAVIASTDLGEKSVTTNVSINFIKKPLLSNLIGISEIKRIGKRLVVGDVEI
ncbi:MAG: PaaI family thioesterase, partial [Paracoccaceae bacterium]